MGGIISHLPEEEINLLSEYGEKVGLAFQIRDDIIDLQSPTEISGKTQGSDELQRKITYPNLIGMESSKKRTAELCEEAKETVKKLSGDSAKLIALSDFISNRDY